MLLKLFFAYLVVHLMILSSLRIDAFSVGLGGQFFKREGGKVSEIIYYFITSYRILCLRAIKTIHFSGPKFNLVAKRTRNEKTIYSIE